MVMAVAPALKPMDVITDFLASRPTSEEIIAYRLPETLEARAHELLERNRNNLLTPDERTEMEAFIEIDHFMTMLKAKTRRNLTGRE
jgi:hypothetical protein